MSFPILSYHPQDQDPRFMWDCDLANNTYKTPKSGGYCYKDGIQTGSEGFSYLESALTYYDGFTMDYSYEFDCSYGDKDNKYGYVQADLKDKNDNYIKKLSFVGNGGIKYGGTSGSFEAAIFDVKAMVAMILEDASILTQSSLTQEQKASLVQKFNESEANKWNLKIDNYVSEPITKLMDAIGYGANISSVYNAYSNQLNDIEDKKEFITELLAYAFLITPAGQTIQLEVSAPSIYICEVNSIVIASENMSYFQNDETLACYIPKIYLQAHWGSGVSYSISSIE